MRCGRYITSSALLARWLVATKPGCVQCDGHKNPYRSHLISPLIALIREHRAQITFCSPSFGCAHRHYCGNYLFHRAFRDADRSHYAGKVLFRRGALCAGGAADARTGDAAADAEPDASAAGKAADRAVDSRLRRRAAGLALSKRAVRIARTRRGVSVRSGAVRGPGTGDRGLPARILQPDAVRAVANRDAGYFRACLLPVRDRRLHTRFPEAAAASLVRARRARLRLFDRLQMERAVRTRGLHRDRQHDPPAAKLAHAICGRQA